MSSNYSPWKGLRATEITKELTDCLRSVCSIIPHCYKVSSWVQRSNMRFQKCNTKWSITNHSDRWQYDRDAHDWQISVRCVVADELDISKTSLEWRRFARDEYWNFLHHFIVKNLQLRSNWMFWLYRINMKIIVLKFSYTWIARTF